jgi:FtsP/CotA-like multicopper oxidase with cupredoxin domain
MRSTFLKAILRTAALAGAGALLSASVSSAADVYLQAQSYSKTLPGATVPMWGFVCDPAAPVNPNCVPSASGSPRINIAAGDSLTIHLTNTLATPVSIVIPGQGGGGDPVTSLDARGRSRVQSFTHETGAGATTPVDYTWSSLRPGT